MNKKGALLLLLVLVLVCTRIFFGLQVNFAHEDYTQIYLIGLENAFLDQWSYWGPDVVWSQTRLAGALQGLLAGLPITLTGHPYSPLILSNLISAMGLILLGIYAHKRFPSLPLVFTIGLVLLLPFGFLHGSVLLNTSYLLFSGSVFFISVLELFCYRDKMLVKRPFLYFFLMGFALLFTYQLHLTWVMMVPIIGVLMLREWKREPEKWRPPFLATLLGAMISGVTLAPTLFTFPEAILLNSGDNLTFQPSRLLKIFDLMIRYLSMATIDVTHTFAVYKLALGKSTITLVLIWVVKVFGILQMPFLLFHLWRAERSPEFKRAVQLFLFTLLMALALFVLGNKHLSARTYILLAPLPIWLSFHVYSRFKDGRFFLRIAGSILFVIWISNVLVALGNKGDIYSFENQSNTIETCFEKKDPNVFGKRRESVMDSFK